MKRPIRQKTQFSLFYLLIALSVLFVVQGWLVAPRPVEIPMSRFLGLVREGKVEKVSLTDKEIRGILKPGALPPAAPAAGDKLRSLLGTEPAHTIFITTRIPGFACLSRRRWPWRPMTLASAASRIAQVLITTRSADSMVGASAQPAVSSRPAISSESLLFI